MEGQYRFDFENDSLELTEYCSDSGWKQYPEGRWCCDSLEPIEGGYSLHHCFDSPQEGCDYLVIRHDPLNVQEYFSYSFRLRHGYDPSAQNNWQLALGAEFTGGRESGESVPRILSGIVLGVNYMGSDDHVKLWRIRDGAVEVLYSTGLNYQEQVGTEKAPLFRIAGDGKGVLRLYMSMDPQSVDPDSLESGFLGSCQVEDLEWGRQLVLRYKYTSSRDRALWLDDLLMEGHFQKDTVAPEVTAVTIVNERRLQLGFSEGVRHPGAEAFNLSSESFPAGFYPSTLR